MTSQSETITTGATYWDAEYEAHVQVIDQTAHMILVRDLFFNQPDRLTTPAALFTVP